ncbi:hypothetical protein H696_06374, partial [Fonticula alba]
APRGLLCTGADGQGPGRPWASACCPPVRGSPLFCGRRRRRRRRQRQRRPQATRHPWHQDQLALRWPAFHDVGLDVGHTEPVARRRNPRGRHRAFPHRLFYPRPLGARQHAGLCGPQVGCRCRVARLEARRARAKARRHGGPLHHRRRGHRQPHPPEGSARGCSRGCSLNRLAIRLALQPARLGQRQEDYPGGRGLGHRRRCPDWPPLGGWLVQRFVLLHQSRPDCRPPGHPRLRWLPRHEALSE